MPQTAPTRKDEVLTFPLPPALKREDSRIARSEKKPVSALLRELVQERMERKRRLAFEAEARRQCLLLAKAVRDPTSDECVVMRELDAELDALADEWK